MRPFSQVDVFTSDPMFGNPVAVILDADGLTDEEMAQFANWTNLSETTFVLPPTDPAADYRVRIFTTNSELPFAGHPTIGTCHAWLEAGGTPKTAGTIIQECGVGLVTLRQNGERLAFAAPPLLRGGSVSDEDLAPVCEALGIERDEIIDSQWCDNGPGWLGVMLESAEKVLNLEPQFDQFNDSKVGVVGEAPLGIVGMSNSNPEQQNSQVGSSTGSVEKYAVEVRAFFASSGQAAEDPVTGSLNAAVAQWLLGNGTLTAPYVARQGTALGRAGYVHIDEADREIWVGGDAVTVISGETGI